MIQLYPKGQTDFTAGGIILHPSEASVTWASGGRYDLSMTIPREMAEGVSFDYGQIVRCPVPVQNIEAISLGTVSYWEVTASGGASIYSELPKTKSVSYGQWKFGTEYSVGAKVTYSGTNYRCTTATQGLSALATPPNAPSHWTQIAGSTEVPGTVVATLANGTTIMKTGDFNSEYMQVATTGGVQGYALISDCTAQGTSEERVVPAFSITEQSFQIITIEKEENGHRIRIDAEHVSYDLGRTMLGECNLVNVNPATALMFVTGAMKEDYPGTLYTNISTGNLTADLSWKNAQAAILDPKAGLLQVTGGQIIRDDYDVYLIPNPEKTPTYQVSYGTNLKTVKWSGDVSGIVTRIYPTAQREDGTTLLLPEEHIDTVRTVPFIRPEMLKTGLKIGQTVKNTDGTEAVLSEDDVYAQMRTMANNRFSIDKADQAEIKLDLDWVHMPSTAEYEQYANLSNAAPLDWVRVVNGPMGISTVIQMTGYTFDPILGRYQKATFGDQKHTASVASYDLQTGSVTGSALAAGAVSSENIVAGTITAREIEANSITAEQIASRVITTQLLAAEAVTAEEIAAGAISTEKLAAGAITADKIASGSITAQQIASGTITAEQIASGTISTVLLAADAVTADKIAAGAVTADSLAAGSVEADAIAAGAITTVKLAADAVTADKIDAGAIQAEHINTSDLVAIHAALGTADIANAQIAVADINYAQVKDLNASSAYFGQAVIQEGLANKLFIPRLSVAYAQIVSATIGDLVIQATNGNYYELDVDTDGNVTATQITPTAEEIAQGHTTAGQTIYLGTEIVAEDLNTTNIYASHALMDQITASTVNVDKLLAREATIAWLNVQDLSSNTYIQSTVGDWTSQSTITQTVAGLNSRISSLGYGTVYMQPNEPSHSSLSSGDIWIQTVPDGTWQEVYDGYSSWNQIYTDVSTWQVLGGIPKMWVWDGRKWQMMYDALLPITVETQIQQLADMIELRATKTEVDTLSGEVSQFNAQLQIQAEQIESAVSTVNAKASSFVMQADPRTQYDVHVGDIWIKENPNTGTWQGICDELASWNEVYSTYDTWLRLLGSITYVWNGTEWIETSDRAQEISNQTKIIQTAEKIELLAQEQATFQNEVVRLQASLFVTASEIRAEVSRATTAENGKIAKTSQYQTADAIVTEAVSQSTTQADGTYLKKTTTYQTADMIVSSAVSQAASEASGAYLAKTDSYQTADAIVNEAVRMSGVNASNGFIAKTDTYATVAAILAKAEAYASSYASSARNASIAKTSTYQTAEAIVNLALAAVDITPVFSASTSYSAGAHVVYGGKVYKFLSAHQGAWTGNDVQQVGVGTSYISKTSTYQTADAIVTQAVSQSGTNAAANYIAKSGDYTTVDTILTQAESLASTYATSAQNASIAKTETYQTAESIMSAAVAQAATDAGSTYIAKTTAYQTADAIVTQAVSQSGTNADAAYIAKSGDYSTVDSILTQAENLASTYATSAQNASIAKTETYQTADAIVDIALAAVDEAPIFNTTTIYPAGSIVICEGKMWKFTADHIGAWTGNDVTQIGVGESYIAKTTVYQTADAIVATAENYTDSNAYAKVSGITITSSGIDISGSQYVKIASGGEFDVTSPGFGVASKSDGYVLWAGAGTAADSPFRVTSGGVVTLTKLMVLAEDGQSETEVNLRTGGLWKLNYNTVKSYSTSDGYCTAMTLSNGSTINFRQGEHWSDISVRLGQSSPVQYNASSNEITVGLELYTYAGGSGSSTTYSKSASVSFTDGPNSGLAYKAGYDAGYIAGDTKVGWDRAKNKYGNAMSGWNLTITYAGTDYDTTTTQNFTIAGIETYSHAGELVYQYSGGTQHSFYIPNNTYYGNPYITTGTTS